MDPDSNIAFVYNSDWIKDIDVTKAGSSDKDDVNDNGWNPLVGEFTRDLGTKVSRSTVSFHKVLSVNTVSSICVLEFLDFSIWFDVNSLNLSAMPVRDVVEGLVVYDDIFPLAVTPFST